MRKPPAFNAADRVSPKSSTLLSLDFGLKRIGTAVGQTITLRATPLTIISAKKGVPLWSDLDRMMAQWQPDALVVGMPVHMDGTELWITEAARQFGASLAERYGLTVHYADERLTTFDAKQHLYGTTKNPVAKTTPIDCFAAKLILESWFSSHYPPTEA